MPRYKLTIEYAGTRYSGWQKQKNAKTIQGEIERAISDLTRDNTFEFYGSGRTDAGVHALHQVAHLEMRKPLPAETIRRGINDALPADLHILAVVPCSLQHLDNEVASQSLRHVARFALGDSVYCSWSADDVYLFSARQADIVMADSENQQS